MVNNSSENEMAAIGSFITSIFLTYVSVIGALGNLISIIVYIHPYFRRTSINLYLLALSIVDFALLTLCLPVFVAGPLNSRIDHDWLQIIHAFAVVYLYPFASIFNTASVWLLVAVTVDRWTAICRPFVVHKRRTALVVSLSIMTLSALFNGIRFGEFKFTSDGLHYILLLRQNESYVLWYGSVCNIIAVYILPLAIVTYYTFQMTTELKRAAYRRRTMSKSERRKTETAE